MRQEIHLEIDGLEYSQETGFSCCEVESIRFILKGNFGAVQYLILVNPDVIWYSSGLFMSADLGYHSPKPIFEGQHVLREWTRTANGGFEFNGPIIDCDILSGPCYYDGSALAGVEVGEILSRFGPEAMWGYLKRYYDEIFVDQGYYDELPDSSRSLAMAP